MNPLTRISMGLAAALALTAALPQERALRPNAPAKLAQLQETLRRTHADSDAARYLRSAEDMHGFLNGSPASTLQLMSSQAFAGKADDAMRSLEEFVGMGQADAAVLESKPFDGLRGMPPYQAMRARMLANTEPVSMAERAFAVGPPGMIAEDIDYDPNSRRFYVTGVRDRNILSVDQSGHSRQFAQSPEHWPMMALKIDVRRRVLWATEAAIDGFTSVSPKDWGRSAILMYDLRSGRLLRRIEGPKPTALGDMALDQNGDAIISDGDRGGVYRISQRTYAIARLDSGDFISPQTPAVLPGGKRFLVPDYLRGIGLLDVDTQQVTWIAMAGKHALSGIDGLYVAGRSLIATQNGTSPERVIRFELDPSLTQIQSESVIERSTQSLGDPTHGVVVGDFFYYIANSGWDGLDEHGRVKPGFVASSAIIMRAKL
jgi:hypothetical protein